MNDSDSEYELNDDNEYFIDDNFDSSSLSSYSVSSEENEDFNQPSSSNQILSNAFNLEENKYSNDAESILLLCPEKIIQDNKIINFKKIMLNVITTHLTTDEMLIVYSIYNYNKNLLLERNKILNEYILINVILNHFNIIILNNTTKIFPEIPWNTNTKKYQKNYKQILEKYDFTNFIKNNKCTKKDLNKPKHLIKAITNGFIFYIKNITLLNKDLFKDKTDDLNEFKKMILKNEKSIFCSDENLQLISDWLSNLTKRILMFNFSNFIMNNKQEKNSISFKKNIEDEIYIIINIIFYLIIILNNENKLIKNNFDYTKLKVFLTFNYKNTFIENLLENNIFKIIIEYIYKNKNNKIFLCKKKYLKFLNKNFL